MNVSQSTPTVQTHYAGLGVRFVALVIDLVLLSMIFFPVTRIVKGVWIMNGSDHLWGYGWLITDPLCLIFLVAIFLYFVLLEGAIGTTIGKKLTGIRVVQADGRHPGLVRAFLEKPAASD